MGWIKLDRKISDNKLWSDKPFAKGQAWIDLLILANHADCKIGKRGEVNRSISFFSDRWGWSRHKVRDFLSWLESEKMVTVKRTGDGTGNVSAITIEKYTIYQGGQEDKGHLEGHQSGQVWDTNRARKRTPQTTAESTEIPMLTEDAHFGEGQKKDTNRDTNKKSKEYKNIYSQSVLMNKLIGNREDMDRLTDYYADVPDLLKEVEAKIKMRKIQTPIFNLYGYVVKAAEEMEWPTVAEKQAKMAKREARLRELEEEDRKGKEELNALARAVFGKE